MLLIYPPPLFGKDVLVFVDRTKPAQARSGRGGVQPEIGAVRAWRCYAKMFGSRMGCGSMAYAVGKMSRTRRKT